MPDQEITHVFQVTEKLYRQGRLRFQPIKLEIRQVHPARWHDKLSAYNSTFEIRQGGTRIVCRYRHPVLLHQAMTALAAEIDRLSIY